MALGTWQIFNTAIAVPAWENLNRADPEHNLVLASRDFVLRDTGLATGAVQLTDLFPVWGAWDVYFGPIDNVGYTAGHISPTIQDPSDIAKVINVSYATAPTGGLIQSLGFAAAAAGTRGGYLGGLWIPPRMRLVGLGLNGGTSCTILAQFLKRSVR